MARAEMSLFRLRYLHSLQSPLVQVPVIEASKMQPKSREGMGGQKIRKKGKSSHCDRLRETQVAEKQ